MSGNVRKFLNLDWSRQSLLFIAFTTLGQVRIQLQRQSFKELVAGLERCAGDEPAPQAQEAPNPRAAEIAWAIGAAAARTPWDSSCLVQVLAAQRMLQARGIGGEFCLGAMKGEESGEEMKNGFYAHAWLTSAGQFITGQAGHEHYRVLARYRWK